MNCCKRILLNLGKNLIARATGRWVPNYPVEAYQHGTMIFSQCGEDILVANILQGMGHSGEWTYVDVGCFDPVQYSNTFFFYLRNGSGLVIDLSEKHRESFKNLRPRDKFISAVLSDSVAPVAVRATGKPTDSVLPGATVCSDNAVHPVTLRSVLEREWPHGKPISFLDVDCEGHDLAVLKSNDWTLYRPWVVVVEELYKTNDPKGTEVEQFMRQNGYSRIACVRMASIFTDDLRVANPEAGLCLTVGSKTEEPNANEAAAPPAPEKVQPNAGETVFAENRRPGDDVTKILSCKVMNTQGATIQKVGSNQEVLCQMTFRVFKEGYCLRPGANVYDELGNALFWTADTALALRQEPLPLGDYSATFVIPKDFLAPGIIIIGAGVGGVGEAAGIAHAYASDCVRLFVEDDLSETSVRGGYVGPVGGFVRPRLDWKTAALPKEKSSPV